MNLSLIIIRSRKVKLLLHAGKFVRIILASVCLCATSATQAVPMFLGANAYEFVEVTNPFVGTNNTLATASAAAASSSFNGVNGHLATVTSQTENDFLLALITSVFSGFNGAWLGGNSTSWLEGPEAGMTFAQVGGYTNWNAVEPNNAGPMYMSIGTSTPNGGSAGNWLDDSGVLGTPSPADPVIGYFIEYEDVRRTNIPEPGMISLLCLGLFGMVLIRRKRPV